MDDAALTQPAPTTPPVSRTQLTPPLPTIEYKAGDITPAERPTTQPSSGVGGRRWAAWQLAVVAVVVGIVAGAAVTFAVTRNNQAERVTPPSVPSAQGNASSPTASVPAPEAAPAPSGAGCGVDLAAPRVVAAVQQLPPYPDTGWTWNADPATFQGNYNPCATLSTVLATVEMATGGSPVTALMFHNGDYLGTATLKAYPFTTLNAVQTTDDTVVLDYKLPGACTACPPAGVTTVRYQWQNDHVEMLDPPPGSAEATPSVVASSSHEVTTHIEWTGPQNFIEYNGPQLTDHTQIVKGKVFGNQVNLVQRAVSGDYYGADPIIGDNAYVSCVVTVDGREVLRDAAARGDGHDCNCLRKMP